MRDDGGAGTPRSSSSVKSEEEKKQMVWRVRLMDKPGPSWLGMFRNVGRVAMDAEERE